MADHAIRTTAQDGGGYSVVDFGGVRHVLAAAVPRRGATLDQQLRDALGAVEAAFREEDTQAAIVQQTVFLAEVGLAEECQRIFRRFYGSDLPATSYVAQPSCTGRLAAIEAIGVGRGGGRVEIQRPSEQLVIVRHDGIAWVYAAPSTPPSPAAGVYRRTTSALEQMGVLFAGAGAGFGQVVRTWLYVGGLGRDNGPTSPYQELNRARTDFYREVSFAAASLPDGHRRRAYPASTGIGSRDERLVLSAIALASERKDLRAVPLENPRQTAAYEYAPAYSPQSPKFSRAMALVCGSDATIFISGTASIRAAETRHPGDAAAQAHETLDNVAALIAERL